MSHARAGTVYLVGAGPGDPELLTVRGLGLVREADVIVHDRLVHPALLAEARVDARVIFAGKRASEHTLPQRHINTLLVHHARAGRSVVRLKGGDPFVLGRGGEEAAALAAAAVPFEIVPGVTSAVAAPAYAGIPVTHRGIASSFAVVTGHGCGDDRAVDWDRVATATDTLVVLMGLATLSRIAEALIRAGRSPDTPTAVIASGTTDAQRVVVARLADIAHRVDAAGLSAPATVVVGDVVRLAERLRWFGSASTRARVTDAREAVATVA